MAATLALPRFSPAVFQQGSFVYVIGGQTGSGQSLVIHSEIQRATFDANDNLSSFMQVGTLPNALAATTAFVSGGTLYLLGGGIGFAYPNYMPTNAILTAPIAGDGTLGAFTVSSLVLPYAVLSAGSLFEGIRFDRFGALQVLQVEAVLERAFDLDMDRVQRVVPNPMAQGIPTHRGRHELELFGRLLFDPSIEELLKRLRDVLQSTFFGRRDFPS
jgi:hypothetical protein